MQALAELKTACETDQIALRGVRLISYLSGLSQKTTIEQTFVNQEGKPIEAVYTFPLPPDSSVCGFEVVTDEKTLRGQVEETTQATQKYEEALERGDGGYLLEQNRPDIFTAWAGNLKPRQAATIRLTYVGPLEVHDRSVRVAYPTTVAPRYVTSTGVDPLQAAVDGEVINPPHHLHVPYGLSLEIHVDLGRDGVSVESPSHQVVIEDGEGREQIVRLAAETTEMDREVVLQVDLPQEVEPVAQAEATQDGEEQFVAVTFVPEFDEDQLPPAQPGETVFVLDCSGSMMGPSIEQARSALELCLKSLSPGDRFNICRFGSTFELMADQPLVYSQKTLDRALDYLQGIDADLGGTEICAPLEAILQKAPSGGGVRQVIVLTDGQVSNEDVAIGLAEQHRKHNRLFTFAIGPAASQHLVQGLARASGGAAESIAPGETIQPKVLRTFSRIASPHLSDLKLDWGTASVEQASADIPAVFDGEPLTITARVTGDLPAEVTLGGQLGEDQVSWQVPVPQVAVISDTRLGKFWARERIRDLEQSGRTSPVSQRRRPGAGAWRQRVIDLSTRYNVLSSLTTFVAIEERAEEERTDGQVEQRRIPIMLAAGWHGIEAMEIAGATRAVMDRNACHVEAVVMERVAAPVRAHRSIDSTIGRTSAYESMDLSADAELYMQEDPRAVAPTRLERLLGCQDAEGGFDLAAVMLLAGEAGVASIEAYAAAEKALEKAGWTCECAEHEQRVIATVLACLLMLRSFSRERDQWQRAEAKARRFLDRQLGGGIRTVTDWIEEESTWSQLVIAAPARRSGSGTGH